MSNKTYIEATDIFKNYGETTALNGVSFEVKKNEIFGFLGPDGAGKTTLFRIMITLLLADSGTAFMGPYDVRKDFKKIRRSIGYMPGRFSLYQDLSVEENLNFFATIFGTTIEANYHLIKDIYQQIEPFKTRRAGNLSGGMKQKLALSCALIHSPDILVLDEPTTGVDAVSRREFWEMLRRLKEQGITILVSTPYMDEAIQCDRVALIQKGKIMEIDEPANISAKFSLPLYEVKAGRMINLLSTLRNWEKTHSVFSFGQNAHFTPDDQHTSAQMIHDFLQEKGFLDITVNKISATIEDSFMEMMMSSQAIENEEQLKK